MLMMMLVVGYSSWKSSLMRLELFGIVVVDSYGGSLGVGV